MAHQMVIVLTDEEYAQLAAQASQNGRPVESVAHDLLAQRLDMSTAVNTHRPLTSSEFTEQQYQDGKVLNLPTRAPLTPAEAAERERRAHLLSGGKSASDMVIEDRGPR